MSCIQEQPTEGVRPNARENGQIRPSSRRSGYPRCCSSQHLASVLQEGRENANIDAGLGYIWRISVKRRLSWLESCQSGLSSALAVPVVPEHDNRTNTAERFKGGQTQ